MLPASCIEHMRSGNYYMPYILAPYSDYSIISLHLHLAISSGNFSNLWLKGMAGWTMRPSVQFSPLTIKEPKKYKEYIQT